MLCDEQLSKKTRAKKLLSTSAYSLFVVTCLPASLCSGDMPCTHLRCLTCPLTHELSEQSLQKRPIQCLSTFFSVLLPLALHGILCFSAHFYHSWVKSLVFLLVLLHDLWYSGETQENIPTNSIINSITLGLALIKARAQQLPVHFR